MNDQTASPERQTPADQNASTSPLHAVVSRWMDTVICGDCFAVMADWPDQCIDAVITDPPYGITSNCWDNVPDLAAWWETVWRICRGPVVMTACQPFTAEIVMSQRKVFRHEWIWQKNRGSNFANTVREPMKEHESVLVFSRGPWTYNPQRQARSEGGLSRAQYGIAFRSKSSNYRAFDERFQSEQSEDRVPSSVQKFNTEVGLHPTQKPQKLFEYLVATYTNESDIVCDPFGGSGTTAAAAKELGRHFVLIEAIEDYCETARRRVRQGMLALSG